MFIFVSFVVSAFCLQAPGEEVEKGEGGRLSRFMSWSRSKKIAVITRCVTLSVCGSVELIILRAALTVSYIIFTVLYWGYFGV